MQVGGSQDAKTGVMTALYQLTGKRREESLDIGYYVIG